MRTPVRDRRFSFSLLAAVAVTAACATAQKGSLPNLPHAFDAGWQGQPTCEVLHQDDEMLVGVCTFPPGVGHERHFHNPHFGYTLAGGRFQIEDEDGTEIVDVPDGATWSRAEVTVHEALNVGETTAKFLIVEPR